MFFHFFNLHISDPLIGIKASFDIIKQCQHPLDVQNLLLVPHLQTKFCYLMEKKFYVEKQGHGCSQDHGLQHDEHHHKRSNCSKVSRNKIWCYCFHKGTTTHSFTEDDKKLINLIVCTRAAIGKSLPYDIYHMVHNYVSAKEMIDMLVVAYERTNEINPTTKNNLNRKYEHFFAYRN